MNLNRKQFELEREQITMALRTWKEELDLRAFGATCPMADCGALAVTYESSDGLSALHNRQFTCAECGAEFSAPPGDLIFESVPREWLFSQVSSA
jgi:aerobic-type carbon monoxide dehydrogenase small subunit (CoxS/CutS family)